MKHLHSFSNQCQYHIQSPGEATELLDVRQWSNTWSLQHYMHSPVFGSPTFKLFFFLRHTKLKDHVVKSPAGAAWKSTSDDKHGFCSTYSWAHAEGGIPCNHKSCNTSFPQGKKIFSLVSQSWKTQLVELVLNYTSSYTWAPQLIHHSEKHL